MEWYYASGNEQRGPVDEARLGELLQTGDVTPETLVWREGLDGWKPYRVIAPQLGGGGASSGGSGEMRTCAYSGEIRPESEMLKYGEQWVRADCKAAFVASLQAGRDFTPGAVVEGEMVYVGFWWRVLAKLIDGVLFMLILAVCVVPALLIGGAGIAEIFEGTGNFEELIPVLIALLLGGLIWFGLNCFYATWMVGKYGATLGKMAIGVRVVGADGSKVSYMRAFGRFWAEFGHTLVFGFVGGFASAILMIPFGIMSGGGGAGGDDMGAFVVLQIIGILLQYGIGYAGYYWAAFHREKASIHDLLCSTRVVRKN